jgi:hypothetical protein
VNPNLPNTRVVELIKATASQCGTYGNGLGWGIIRADEAVLAAVGKDIDPPSSQVLSAKKIKKGRRGRRRLPTIRLRFDRKDERQARCAQLPVSGVQKVVVFVSRNGGAYRQISKLPTGDSLIFRPKRRGVFRFFSIAVDNADNQEAAPPVEDAKRKLPERKRR